MAKRSREAEILRDVRRAFKLTQAQVAARAGLNREHYVRLEGHLQASTDAVRVSIATAYGVTRDDVAALLDARITVGEFCRRVKLDPGGQREDAGAGAPPLPPARKRLDETPAPPSHTTERLKLGS